MFNAGIDISSAGFSFDQIKGYKKKEGKELDTHTHTHTEKKYIFIVQCIRASSSIILTSSSTVVFIGISCSPLKNTT